MNRNTEFIPYSRPSLGIEEEQAALEVIRSGWLTTGPQAAAFEREFAAFVGSSHALAVNSATAGLHLALESLGVGPGDLVATSPYTFTATAEVIRYLGADPVFIDVEEESRNMDPVLLAGHLEGGRQVRAVIPIHIGGLPCDMDALRAAAGEVPILEDAAHAFPVRSGGRYAGTIGELGVYSFYANKTMTTGEGGMVVTQREDLARRVAVMRNHGIDREAWSRYTTRGAGWRYAVVEAGYKYNMPDLAAAIGRAQLRKAVDFLDRRRRVAEQYLAGLADCDFLRLPPAAPEHAWHLFMIQLQPDALRLDRDRFIDALLDAGIGTSVHYIPLHMMPYYSRRYGLRPGDFPISRRVFERTVSLPIYPDLSPEETDRVIEAIRQIGYSARR